MDIPQQTKKKKLSIKQLVVAASLGMVAFYGWTQINSKSETPNINTADLIMGIVTTGDLIRDVRAPGTLQPTKLRWIAASSSSRVEEILIQPGAQVKEDTVIMSLSNPTLARDVETASFALEVVKAELIALKKRMESELLAQEATIADVNSNYQNAHFRMQANKKLGEKGIVSALDVKEAELLEAQLEIRLAIEKKRQVNLRELQLADLQAKQASINQAQSQLNLQQSLVDDLQVKAGLSGILQLVPVEQGQQINSGVVLARVAREDSLKAELNVQESQVGGVLVGQSVIISAGGQQAKGIVQRIDPSVQNGVVTVDVSFVGDGLKNARPDLRIDGLIELERLENIKILQRPVYSKENNSANLYIVSDLNASAQLVNVQLGIASLDKIQILSGLKVGEKVIVSDTSQFNLQKTISLN